MEKEKFFTLQEGMLIYIKSDVASEKRFGTTNEMKNMIGRFYQVKTLDKQSLGVKVANTKVNMTFIFHIDDIDFLPSFYYNNDEEKFFISSINDTIVDPSLFLD